MSGSATRFQKGQSGNPKGRPRKKREIDSSSAFAIVLDEVVTVQDRNSTRTLSAEEALQYRTYQDALKGGRIAQRMIMRMIAKREAWRARHAPPSPGVRVKLEQPDRRGLAREAMLVLGIAAGESGDEPGKMLLEPWAVEAALKRLRGRKLNRLEAGEIRVATRGYPSLGLARYCDDAGS